MYGSESGDQRHSMERSGANWLLKVGAATALLALIGILAASAGNNNSAPTEPPARQLHWSATG